MPSYPDRDRLILALPGNGAIAGLIAAAGNWELGAMETRSFPDGETYVRILSDVTGRAVSIVCTLARPDAGFLRLVFAADAVRAMGAGEITLVAPYLAYMRQDRRFLPGEAITSRSFARLVSSTFDRLITVDPHLHRYPELSTLYSIPAGTLHAAPLLADWVRENITRPLLIGPDEESEQWVSGMARRIGAPFTVLRKIRHGDRKVTVELPDLSAWGDRNVVLVDDIASSGQTLIEASHKLTAQGFAPPACVIVHGVFAEESFVRLKAVTSRIVTSDSIPHESNAIGLAQLLAEAIKSPGNISAAGIRQRRPPEAPDIVERAGNESFPASDPPPWTTG